MEHQFDYEVSREHKAGTVSVEVIAICDIIDRLSDARDVLHAVMMSTSRLDRKDGSAIEKLCDIADDWMNAAMDDLYKIKDPS